MYKSSYKVLAFSFLLMCSVGGIFADDTAAGSNASAAALAENEIVLQTDETALPVQGDAPRRSSGTSTGSMLFQLILSLVIVCALVYGVLYFIRRSKQFTAGDDPFLKDVANLPIAPNKTLHIVTLIDRAYLIGVSDASVSLIAEITDKELIDAMNLHAAQTAGPKQNFSSFLHTFFPAAKPKEADANPFDSFLTKQRERLHNSGVTPENSALQDSGFGHARRNGNIGERTGVGEAER